jgi:hypothetical protein
MQSRPNISDVTAIHVEKFVDLEPGNDAPRVSVGIVHFIRVDWLLRRSYNSAYAKGDLATRTLSNQ